MVASAANAAHWHRPAPPEQARLGIQGIVAAHDCRLMIVCGIVSMPEYTGSNSTLPLAGPPRRRRHRSTRGYEPGGGCGGGVGWHAGAVSLPGLTRHPATLWLW
jgi:hypothetical protein